MPSNLNLDYYYVIVTPPNVLRQRKQREREYNRVQ